MISFKDMSTKNTGTLLVVDALNLAFRWSHSKSTKFVDDYIKTVQSLAQSYKCDRVIIACDQGSSSYRTGIYPEYKGNRKAKYANQTEQEANEFKAFLTEFNATMDAIASIYPVIKFENVEADDIAAYIVQEHKKYNVNEIWLVSSDADWKLLIADNVSKFSYVTRKEDTISNWSDNHDFSIEEFISMKCLIGDSGDNVKGVEGIGPKRALGLVRDYGSAFDIVDALPISSKYKYIQAVNTSKDLILLNYKLMDLVEYCEEAIGETNCHAIDEVLKEYLTEKKV
jgi:5'-3' exonuclease